MRFWDRLSEIIADTLVKRRVLVIGVLALLIGAGIWIVGSRQNFDTEVLNLLPADEPSVQTLKIINEQFAQTRELTFVLQGEQELVADFAEHFIAELGKEAWVVRAFGGMPFETSEGLDSISGALSVLVLNLEDDAFRAALDSLHPDKMQARLNRMHEKIASGSLKDEQQLASDPTGLLFQALAPFQQLEGGRHRTTMESEDGTLRIVPVITDQATLSQNDCVALMEKVDGFRNRVRQSWLAAHADRGAPEVMVTGRSPFVAQISGSMQRDIQVTSTISILAVTALFYFGFRRLSPLLGITFILGLSCFASFALGSLFFDKLSVIAIAFCSILVGLGDDFSLLLYNRYLRARTEDQDHRTAISTSIREVSRGIFFVAFTTGAGFLALAGSSSRGFAQLGVLIAVGIVMCAIFMVTLLFLFIPRNTTSGARDRSRAILTPLVLGAQRWRSLLGVAALAVFALVVCYAVLPIRPLSFDTNPRSLEPRDIPASIALRTIGEKLPGVREQMIALVESHDSEQAHQQWTKLTAQMQAMKDAEKIDDFASPIGLQFSPARLAAHQRDLAAVQWDKVRDDFFRTAAAEGFNPEKLQTAGRVFDGLKAAAMAPIDSLTLRNLIPPRSSWWFLIDRFIAQDPNFVAGYFRPAQPLTTPEELKASQDELQKSGVQVRVTGWSYSLLSLVPWARREAMVFSIGVSSLILVMLALAYRNWRPWLTHILSLIFALSLTIVVLKIAHVQINMLNALAFPLILGVGVDYGMHILLAAHDTEELATVFKPVVISGLTTIIGFGALMAARNPALSGLGVVCSVGVASCLVSALLFAVPVLGLFPQRRS